jgi:PAS domain-containing protein
MYLPVYRHGVPLETIAQRRAALTGWVYSPYRMTDLLRGSLQGWEDRLKDRRISFQVYDGDVVSAETLLFANQSVGDRTRDSGAQVIRLVTAEFAGHSWTLRFTQLGGAAAMADYRTTWLALFGGTIVSLLLFWLTLSLLGTRTNAKRIAAQLTKEIRESEKRFATLADAAPVLIWEAGTDKLCTFFNKTWLEFTGRTLAQEMGNSWADDVHPDDLARCLEIFRRPAGIRDGVPTPPPRRRISLAPRSRRAPLPH